MREKSRRIVCTTEYVNCLASVLVSHVWSASSWDTLGAGTDQTPADSMFRFEAPQERAGRMHGRCTESIVSVAQQGHATAPGKRSDAGSLKFGVVHLQ